jgi:PRTRC genetic system protein C
MAATPNTQATTTNTQTTTPATETQTTDRVRRVFVFNGTQLSPPEKGMTPDQVRVHFSAQFPALTSATIQGPDVRDGKEFYNFIAAAKTKG